jgi:hypothetical protein
VRIIVDPAPKPHGGHQVREIVIQQNQGAVNVRCPPPGSDIEVIAN